MTDRLRYGLVPLVARLLLVTEFLIAVNGKISGWDGQAAYMASHGMHFVAPLLGMALAIELVGSLCLITGIGAKTAGAIMFVYLAIVTVRLHDFWHQTGMPAAANQTQFFKNLSIMGGLLLMAAYGPGRWALSPRATQWSDSSASRVPAGKALARAPTSMSSAATVARTTPSRGN
jgi:putative oxidoreductase